MNLPVITYKLYGFAIMPTLLWICDDANIAIIIYKCSRGLQTLLN